MDIQLICLDAWLDIIQENAKHTSTTKRLKDELHSLYNRLEKLSTIHPQAEVRDMYTAFEKNGSIFFLMGRIVWDDEKMVVQIE